MSEYIFCHLLTATATRTTCLEENNCYAIRKLSA